MEIITLINPESGTDIEIEINAEVFEYQQVWRVKFENENSALLGIDPHGIWIQFDNNDLNPKLISSIGNAIEAKDF